jgi:hypothetical protein
MKPSLPEPLTYCCLPPIVVVSIVEDVVEFDATIADDDDYGGD